MTLLIQSRTSKATVSKAGAQYQVKAARVTRWSSLEAAILGAFAQLDKLDEQAGRAGELLFEVM